MNREQYERDLADRQRRHMERIFVPQCQRPWKPCAHDQCTSCHGTGVREDGRACMHMLSCDCPRCSRTGPMMMSGNPDPALFPPTFIGVSAPIECATGPNPHIGAVASNSLPPTVHIEVDGEFARACRETWVPYLNDRPSSV